MTDGDLVAKKLAQIETYVAQLRALGRPQAIHDDLMQERFIEHTLQLAIQAAQDVASHIVSDDRLGEPRTNRELFDLLADAAWIERDLAGVLQDMVGLRNVLVHGYDSVDLGVVEDVVANHLDDLLRFASALRGRIEP